MTDKEMLEDLKSTVNFAKKDYYSGMGVLSIKEIDWLIQQADKVERYEQALKDVYSKTFIMSSYAGFECNQIIEKALEIKYS